MIAVVIPVYNVEIYLQRCINSILDCAGCLFIFVNDGSTDNSLKILNKNLKLRRNFLIINKQNGGLASARNTGIQFLIDNKINPEYIAFIDSDDYVDDGYFDILLKMSELNNADIVCSSFVYTTSKSLKKYIQTSTDKLLNNIEALKLLLEDRSIQSHAHCKLYKFSLFEDIRFPENVKILEDQPTTYKVFLKAQRIFVTNYAGYHYWQEGESLCRSRMTNKKVLDSLNGYLTPIKDVNLPKECLWSAIQGYANCFLMMYPRFNKKIATKEEKNEFKEIIKFTNNNKYVKKFKPICKSERMKKAAYLYARPLYKILFKIFA